MDDYISRQAAIEAVFEAFADGRSTYVALEAIPPADVRPVVSGKWIEDVGVFGAIAETDHVEIPAHKCSACGEITPAPWCKNYCPNCGADMRGDDAI